MATATTIEWTEETWNPVTGCSKVSDGCANCYAETMARRLQAMGAVPSFSSSGAHGAWTRSSGTRRQMGDYCLGRPGVLIQRKQLQEKYNDCHTATQE